MLETAPGGVETDVGTADTNVFGAATSRCRTRSPRPATGASARPPARVAARPGPYRGRRRRPHAVGTLEAPGSRPPQSSVTCVTAHLGDPATNPQVSIFRTPAGGSPEQVGSGAVDVNGNFKATVTLTRTSSFTAHWDGDGVFTRRDPPPGRSRRPTWPYRAPGSSRPYSRPAPTGCYHFHSSVLVAGSKGCVSGRPRLKPNKAGERVTFRAAAQALRPLAVGGDRHHRHQRPRASPPAISAMRKSLIGTNFRFVARFARDSTNLGGRPSSPTSASPSERKCAESGCRPVAAFAQASQGTTAPRR